MYIDQIYNYVLEKCIGFRLPSIQILDRGLLEYFGPHGISVLIDGLQNPYNDYIVVIIALSPNSIHFYGF